MSLLNCSQRQGTICQSNEACSVPFINSHDSIRCCAGTCSHALTCSEQNGNICIAGQTCSGNILSASDSSYCCSGTCNNQTNPDPGMCGDSICNNGETCSTCAVDCGQCSGNGGGGGGGGSGGTSGSVRNKTLIQKVGDALGTIIKPEEETPGVVQNQSDTGNVTETVKLNWKLIVYAIAGLILVVGAVLFFEIRSRFRERQAIREIRAGN